MQMLLWELKQVLRATPPATIILLIVPLLVFITSVMYFRHPNTKSGKRVVFLSFGVSALLLWMFFLYIGSLVFFSG